MNYIISVYLFILFIQTIISSDYNGDGQSTENDDEKQTMPYFGLPNLFQIEYLSSSVFDSLTRENTSNSYILMDQTIFLHGFGITQIDVNTFMNCHQKVRTIILSSNFLYFLPRNVFKPFRRTLINLNLQNNRIRSLNKNKFLQHLGQLLTLDLSKNRINEISTENFIGLKSLETLILRQNHIEYLSRSAFRHCQKLTTLDLSDNKISKIDSETFYLLNHLKILVLSNNPLGQHSLTRNLMKPLINLEYIDLENTQLENLPSYLFVSNRHLKSIKLRQNNFQENNVLKRTFCYANSLVEIDLVSSNIRSLDTCTYHQIPSLRRLYLMNNPLDCTCDLFYLKYGDIYRLLRIEDNDIDQIDSNVDKYLNYWISKPDLRRRLENAYEKGDLYRLPIELSLFARCSTPIQWKGHEIDNITNIYNQCQNRWIQIDNECRNYCQNGSIEIRSISSKRFHSDLHVFRICFIFFFLFRFL